MSKSYRKGMQCCGDKTFKKIFNRRLRRSQKCADIPNGAAYKRYNNSWNIADYRGLTTWEDFKTWSWVFNKTDGWNPKGLADFNDEKGAYAHWKRHYASK